MDVFSFLETTAEISITFAGFVSLFFVLAKREGPLASEIAVLIRFILVGSVISLFLAVLPLLASGIGLGGVSLWRMASGSGVAASVGMGLFAAKQRSSLAEREVTVFVLIAWPLAALSVLVSVSNIVGWPIPPNGGMYLTSIWLGLAIGAVNLVDLVFRFALKEPAA